MGLASLRVGGIGASVAQGMWHMGLASLRVGQIWG